MPFQLNDRSETNLLGVDPELIRVVRRTAEISELEFVVIEGLRTAQRQAALVKAGASHTLNSKHLIGRAVDLAALVDGDVRWDWPLYEHLGMIMKVAASDVGVRITWGGDWVTFRDGPHFELSQTA